MDLNQAKDEIKKLNEQIAYHNEKYYVEDKPQISDYEYDMLLKRLEDLENEFPQLKSESSASQNVGGRADAQFEPVEHPYPLLSLQDVFSYDELADFDSRVKKVCTSPEYVVELKIDGLSVALEYQQGKFVKGATRGNGVIGENVTENLKTIKNIPKVLKNPVDIIVRGEVYMPRSSFEKLNQSRKAMQKTLFANPRNAAAGSLRQLDSSITAERNLDIFIFNIQNEVSAVQSHCQALDYLKDLGFKVSPFYNKFNTISEAFAEIERFDSIRNDLDFDIDGAVVKVNNFIQREKLGSTSKFPRWAAAFKYPPEQKPTRLTDIVINVGRTGVLTPNAVLEPVSLAGTTVSKSTLHNKNFIHDLDIRIGDTVIVQKAGDIIPEIVRVDKSKRTGAEKEFHMPEKCPVCTSSVITDESGIAVRCPNSMCPAQVYRSIVHFATKDAMDIEGLGEAIVNQLIDEGLVTDVSSLYDLTVDKLKNLERFGEKSASNLVNSIEQSKQSGLEHVIFALGIRNVGQRASKLLAKRFKNIEALMQADAQSIAEIDDMGLITANNIVEFFSIERNKKLIEKLKSAGVLMDYTNDVTDDRLSGMTFVLSGGLESMTRDEASEKIEQLGGKTSSSVSSKTSYLVLGDKPGSKAKKAQQLKIPIIDEAEFLNMIQ